MIFFLKIRFAVIAVGQENCIICMEVMAYMHIITEQPCLHNFRQECAIGWLARVRNMILVCSCFYREMLEIIILIITIVHAHWLQSTA